MKIETTYAINDRVFLIYENKVYSAIIRAISVYVGVNKEEHYFVDVILQEGANFYKYLNETPLEFGSEVLFKTKQELIDSL